MTAATPATRKPKTPALASQPEIERVVADAMRAHVPAVTRDSLAIETMASGVRVLEAEKAAISEQRSYYQRIFGALDESLANAEADADRAIARYRSGLPDDGVEQGQQ